MNTQISALCESLLKGETISVFNAFKWFGITNASREIGRSIERKFGVKVDRKKVEFKSRYGMPGYYFEYRLYHTPENKDGILKMAEYVSKNKSMMIVRKQIKGFKQPKLFA